MSSRIDYDIHTSFGRRIAELAQTIVTAKNQAANLKAAMDSMAVGTPPTYTQIEAEVGGMAIGSGETLYNVLTDMNQKLSGNTLDAVYRLFKG